ncbi:hypothetical protein BV25DRAFT_1640645 [Artomyces pyxidatus]|uniref:Uncharacterized protein n=1 Tax=Artomyces pyxidatus TaxID=48021 RepID=A0ACB8SJV5_9AGAM|nr:hypothetical protein BV25DRAFT_1640645 [Artomyces pyxidatus]
MSVITPRLDTSLPTTPSHEWAKDTMRTALPSDGTSQLQSNNPYFNSSSTPSNYPVQQDQPIQTTTNAVPHVTNPYAPASSTSTPGNDVPGSYPREAESAASANYSPSQILNSAKQYIPDPNAAQSVLLTAGQTAKAYLPATVTGYLSGTQKTSLPSTETQGIQPGEHQDGVGALPGTRDEAGVAKLPEEQSSQTSTERPGLHWQDSEGVGEWGQGGLHKGDERVVDKGLESVGTSGSAGDREASGKRCTLG